MQKDRRLTPKMKQMILTLGIIFLLIPLTIFIGIRYFGDRAYLFISVLILFYTFVPFIVSFEGRRPQAREVMMLAVMAAIAVVGNLGFFWAGPFQAGTALVIIAGICLGPTEGFLTGAMARLVINMFAGQGPWTPWQMACWGLLGFLGGICFNKDKEYIRKDTRFKIVTGPLVGVIISEAVGFVIATVTKSQYGGWWLYAFGAIGLLIGLIIQRNRLPADRITLAIFGFLTTFIIYGGIMNIAAMVMSAAVPGSEVGINWTSLKVLYISGVPYDGVHALASAIFCALLGPPMIEKVERVKIKYGLYQVNGPTLESEVKEKK